MKVRGFFYSSTGSSCGIDLMFGEYILVGDTEIFYKYFFAVVCNDS